jgi:hypothetical protein
MAMAEGTWGQTILLLVRSVNCIGMNKEQYLQTFKEITDQMYETTKRKNADYTGDTDNPFKNFEMVESIGFATTEQGFMTRITDKIMRVSTFVKTGILKVADEKVEDTLLDCAVYCILFVCYLRSKRKD